eukprot:CAMPEP_0205826634 /NCGR_PEP_ID=MMETSP0206-20130828/29359_1 /ASSEMBLY_ACC=CAM_ASM_000279 /TAXON_ID=36767 /ORGANISM="Euplotes focardii, Strain TN1" /LENGTH=80 /DNA_ID=CAMNT_0053126735 /DNA_START=6 /DNA_END=248 /DNA_ORIENTATION=+
MPRRAWTDKELIDAPVELLNEGDIKRQRKLQEKRAKKLAKEEEKAARAMAKADQRLSKKHKSKAGKDAFGDFSITGSMDL